MNYGTPKGSVWSPCSQRDFQNYYNRVIQTLSNFCLPEYTGEFYIFHNTDVLHFLNSLSCLFNEKHCGAGTPY